MPRLMIPTLGMQRIKSQYPDFDSLPESRQRKIWRDVKLELDKQERARLADKAAREAAQKAQAAARRANEEAENAFLRGFLDDLRQQVAKNNLRPVKFEPEETDHLSAAALHTEGSQASPSTEQPATSKPPIPKRSKSPKTKGGKRKTSHGGRKRNRFRGRKH